MASPEDDGYILSRSYQQSARLVLQHWLFLNQLKYILHPSIPSDSPELHIADVAPATRYG